MYLSTLCSLCWFAVDFFARSLLYAHCCHAITLALARLSCLHGCKNMFQNMFSKYDKRVILPQNYTKLNTILVLRVCACLITISICISFTWYKISTSESWNFTSNRMPQQEPLKTYSRPPSTTMSTHINCTGGNVIETALQSEKQKWHQ